MVFFNYFYEAKLKYIVPFLQQESNIKSIRTLLAYFYQLKERRACSYPCRANSESESYSKLTVQALNESQQIYPSWPLNLAARCLGRIWLQRGREEKERDFIKTALVITKRALVIVPGNTAVSFNIAYLQMVIAEIMHALPENKRSVSEMEVATAGLDQAVSSLMELAKDLNAPFPAEDIQQRANMGQNTLKRQFEQALQQQITFEHHRIKIREEARVKLEVEEAERL